MSNPHLKRNLSLWLVTLYGLGNILGAGIYVLIGKVAGYSGENTILAFLIAMVIAGLTAFSYMELSSRFPKSASVSVYIHNAFRMRLLSVAIGLALVFGGVASAAALSQGFAGYLGDILPVPEALASIGLLIFLGLVAAKGIGESAKFAAVFTLIEVAGLAMIIWAGRTAINVGDFTASLHIDPAIGFTGIMMGAFLAFYAFIGFEDMVNVVEEAKKPRVTMPVAIFLSLISATVLYLLVVIVSITVVEPSQLAKSEAPLSLVFSKVSSLNPLYISVIGLAATINGVLVQIIMGSRILYGLSKQGWLHKDLSVVHSVHRTPVLATAIVVALMVLGTTLLGLVSLAKATSYLVLVVFTLVNVSLVTIKRRGGKSRSQVSVPMAVPVLGTLTCASMIVFQTLNG